MWSIWCYILRSLRRRHRELVHRVRNHYISLRARAAAAIRRRLMRWISRRVGTSSLHRKMGEATLVVGRHVWTGFESVIRALFRVFSGILNRFWSVCTMAAAEEARILAYMLASLLCIGCIGLLYVLSFLGIWVLRLLCFLVSWLRHIAWVLGSNTESVLIHFFTLLSAFFSRSLRSTSRLVEVTGILPDIEEVVVDNLSCGGDSVGVNDASTDGHQSGPEDDHIDDERETNTQPATHKSRKPHRFFDHEENDVLRELCVRADSPDDYRFNRGLAGCNMNLAENFNAEMARRRPGFIPREVENIAKRVNRPDFKNFLDAEGVPPQRTPSRMWSSSDTATLETLVLAQARIHPSWVRVANGELEMSYDFQRLLVIAATRAGINRSWREIVDKVKHSRALVERLQNLL